MKKTLLLTCLVFISFFTNAQWADSFYSSKSMSLTYGFGTRIISGSTALVYGVGGSSVGKIFRTTNGGSTFSEVVSAGNRFDDASFVDANTGYVVGESDDFELQISKTENAGQSWSTTTNSDYNGGTSIQFINSTTGFIATEDGILRTKDGGITWSNVYEHAVSTVYFPTATVGYAVFQLAGTCYVYKTIDGGDNWTDLSANFDYGYALETMYFATADIGFIIPKGGTDIYRTDDGGQTWNLKSITSSSGNFYEIKFLNASVGYICGESSFSGAWIYKTTDGGLTWSLETQRSSVFSYYSFDISGSLIIAAGYYGYSKNASFTVATGVEDDIWVQNSALYPNPAKEVVTVGTNVTRVEFYNSLGVLIKSAEYSVVNVADLENGIYSVSVTAQDGSVHKQKFVKE